MASKAKSRGSGSGCFMRFLFLVVIGYLLISWLPQCAQELPQLAGNAAHGVAGAAANSLSNLGRHLLNRVESLFGAESPAEQFQQVCEHIPVEGVDKVCPYFTSALQGATEAQVAQTACYLTAIGKAPNGQQTLQTVRQTCPQTPNNAAAFQTCVQNYVSNYAEPGDVANCLSSSEQQFESEVHTMTEPIACIPGLPKSWCTTQSSSAPTTQPGVPTRTDPNYLNCLQNYYQSPAVKAAVGSSCGTAVNAGNAACVTGALQSFNYPGQSQLGQQYVQYCGAQPQ
ncbi:MAG TPA: hypothetical protein VHY36_17135 [Steroidobacteraceae bacterium]|nr:hypothetical protein [Steroidobacteraceae bacterium]